MIRTNLSTRPFYNERVVRLWLLIAAVLVAAVTLFNVSSVLYYSRLDTERETQIARDEAQAEELRRSAAKLRAGVNTSEIDRRGDAVRLAVVLLVQTAGRRTRSAGGDVARARPGSADVERRGRGGMGTRCRRRGRVGCAVGRRGVVVGPRADRALGAPPRGRRHSRRRRCRRPFVLDQRAPGAHSAGGPARPRGQDRGSEGKARGRAAADDRQPHHHFRALGRRRHVRRQAARRDADRSTRGA